MFLTIVRIFPTAKEKEAIRGFLGALVRPVCMQRGCLGCSLALESDPDALVLTETWESEEYLVRRLQSDGYAKVLATMEMSIKRPEVFIYEVVHRHGLESIERIRMVSKEDHLSA
jgi:quinol monooxygenase YgiN